MTSTKMIASVMAGVAVQMISRRTVAVDLARIGAIVGRHTKANQRDGQNTDDAGEQQPEMTSSSQNRLVMDSPWVVTGLKLSIFFLR